MHVAMRTITAYHSVHHDSPLIVLPSMKLMYFANHIEHGFHVAARGAQLGVRNGKDIYQSLENALAQWGCWRNQGREGAILGDNRSRFQHTSPLHGTFLSVARVCGRIGNNAKIYPLMAD